MKALTGMTASQAAEELRRRLMRNNFPFSIALSATDAEHLASLLEQGARLEQSEASAHQRAEAAIAVMLRERGKLEAANLRLEQGASPLPTPSSSARSCALRTGRD